MQIQHLQEFRVLAECRNFTNAANQLFISQPTLSKHIAQLEEELEIRLFQREKKELLLTPAGEILLDAAEKMLSIYDHAITDISKTSGETSGQLRIDVFLYGIQQLVYPFTNRLKERFPRIQLNISSPHPLDPITKLISNQTDIAQIFRFPHSNLESMDYIDVASSRFCFGMPYNHHLVNKEHIYLADLEGETMVFSKTASEFNEYFKSYLKKRNFVIYKEILVDTVDTMYVMAENYNMIAPMQSINLDPNYRKNVFRYIEDGDDSVKIAFAWKKDNHNPGIEAFRQVVQEILMSSI